MIKLYQTWDNSYFFSGSDDPQISVTIDNLRVEIAALANICSPFIGLIETAGALPSHRFEELLGHLRVVHQQRTDMAKILGNLRTFITSVLSVNSRDASATAWKPTIQQLGAELDQAAMPLDVFLLRVDEKFIQSMADDPLLAEMCFHLQHQRKLQDQLLSVAEESLLAGLKVNGLHGWGNLYTKLAGTLQCTVGGRSFGLATCFNFLSSADRTVRSEAWHGIQTAWESQAEPVAALLNAINGWRLEETKQRSQHRQAASLMLDNSCHSNCIDRATLESMMIATYDRRSIGQRALKAMGKSLNLEPAPWDLFAPPPAGNNARKFTFDESIELVANAFRQLNPAMGDFAVMMAAKGWIDAKPSDNRATGAYCSSFARPKEPRIFMTFEGTMNNVVILAHELGHAWHEWVMRDLPRYQTFYPMTLAETASIFAETLVRDSLLAEATSSDQKLRIAWEDGAAAISYLLNIPSRFTFEQRFVEARRAGFVTVDNLKSMMTDSWQHWYEESLVSYDGMFWASKAHFSMSNFGFYNYPYLFGYLFSLSVNAQKDRYGAGFNDMYTDLLRDTGRMTAEDLVSRHFHQDIRTVEFWHASLDVVEKAVERLEELVG